MSAAATAHHDLAQMDDGTVSVAALPLFHVYGMTCVLNSTLFAGGCVTIVERFDPDLALTTVERDRATVFAGVPTMYSSLLHAPEHNRFDTTSLKHQGPGVFRDCPF